MESAARTHQLAQYIRVNDSSGVATTLETRVADGKAVLDSWEARLRGAVAESLPDIEYVFMGQLFVPQYLRVSLTFVALTKRDAPR